MKTIEQTEEQKKAAELRRWPNMEYTPDGNETYWVFVRDWWRIENGKRVPYPGAPRRTIARGVSYDQARELCEDYNNSHNPGEVSRKAEFTEE